MRVVIVGNGIVGCMAALYLRRLLPQKVEVVVIGPDTREGMPIVGESTIEITAQFLENKLGLARYLADHHNPKYALTYYFKLTSDPSDRTYSVQCNQRDPKDLKPLERWQGPMARPPSWQLNRPVFDRDLLEMVRSDPGIHRIAGRVKEIDLRPGFRDAHTITVARADGRTESLDATWLIDASGRRQLLARRLGHRGRPKKKQRNCFWFRLTGFDGDILRDIQALGPMPDGVGEPYHYDRYYSTHHFMGRGNWIWLIPMRVVGGDDIMSVGLSTRPDVYPYRVRNVEDFLTHVGAEHPVVAEFTRSGRVEDTNILNNYRHAVQQVYSEDRWCIIGDAAFAPDPLFSNGLAFSTIQIEQAGAMISRDLRNQLDVEYIRRLERIFWKPVRGSQNTIANWYESMDDPLLCALRLHFIEVTYFYFVLPLVVNRCHYEPDRLDMWSFMSNAENGLELPKSIMSLRNRIEVPRAEHFVYQGKEKVNLDALRVVEDLEELRGQFVAGSRLLQDYVHQVESLWSAA